MSETSVLSSVRDWFTEYSRVTLSVAIIIALLFFVLPGVVNPYITTITVSFLFGVIIASSWNILAMTGYINFGHAMFIGLGSFTAGLSTLYLGIGTSVGVGLVFVVVFGGLVSMGFALLLGYPLLRLRGHYFAIATLGVAEALLALFSSVHALHGAAGILMPPLQSTLASPLQIIYYMMLVVALATVITTYLIKGSKLGYAFRAIRLGEDAAETLGVPTTFYSVIAFAISGFFAGAGGAVYAYRLSFVQATNVFSIMLTIHAIVVTMIGGLGTIIGPVVGAGFYTALVDIILDFVLGTFTAQGQGRLLIIGLIIVIIIITTPEGIVPRLRRYLRNRSQNSTEDGG